MSSAKGYHLASIPRGTYGHFSKIEEELLEAKDALDQENKLMFLQELSDVIGAVEGVLENEFKGVVTLNDLARMARCTKRAFQNGHRMSR